LENPLCRPAAEASQDTPDSPGGWSDLPSDAEDTFFFSPEEAEDYHRDKKRRYLEQVREERLQARQAEEGETPEEVWGRSDEEVFASSSPPPPPYLSKLTNANWHSPTKIRKN